MRKNIAPSLLAADFFNLSSQLEILKKAGVNTLHLDVMDGLFVPSISFGIPVTASLNQSCDMFFDVHMMVERPERYIEDFYKSGADGITVHYEACNHLDRCINQIKSFGLRSGVAINPATPVSLLHNIITEVDMVLIMSVNPGFGGQKFIPYSIEKIKELDAMRNVRNKNLIIQVDGGVTSENIKELSHAGVNEFVAGSSVFKGDILKNVKALENGY